MLYIIAFIILIYNMNNCVFCDIVLHKIPSYIIDENDEIIAILPKDMECFWHTLIIPKNHYENIFDIDDDSLNYVLKFMKNLAIKYKKYLWATWVNILNASWKDAQQSVLHFHFHLIPRFEDDRMDMWPKLEKYNWNQKNDLQIIRNKIFF